MTVTASNFTRNANDLYETEPWATEALLRRFPMRDLKVWEPSAGNHKIVRVLRKSGANVIATDIIEYDVWHDMEFDFLSEPESETLLVDAIVTNPPYGKGNRDAVKYAELALKRCSGTIALLLTGKFDFGKTRAHLFANNPRFTAKINLVDRISWAGNGETGTEDHAWYVWTERRPYEYPVIMYEGKNQ